MREKTGGRKAGTPNRITNEIKETISGILQENFNAEKVKADLDEMQPKDRLTFMCKLLDYVAPKIKQVEIINDADEQVKLTPEQREKRINELREKLFQEN